MLSDFLSLERIFESHETTLFTDDVISKYGQSPVLNAIKEGYLKNSILCIGPDCGREICWLSSKGRRAAHQMMH